MENNTMAYEGFEPYAFISYSHADRLKVERLLRMLSKENKRFWYDAGIRCSDEWEAKINERLQSSAIFILFLSNGVEQRSEVIRELRLAMKKREQSKGEYRIFVVMLERVPVPHIFRGEEFRDVLALLQSVQYVSMEALGGYTVRFKELLCGNEIWKYCGLGDKTGSADTDGGLETLDSLSFESGYIYPYAEPEDNENDAAKEEGIVFYKVNIGETDPNAVYPICIDNQWCPKEYFLDERFRNKGFGDSELEERRCAMQQNELITALLHNRQILINRASIFNSKAIARWYMSGNDEERKAFCALLENGSFVIYLMFERSPVEKPKFDVDKAQFDCWKDICRTNKVYCIRMSWAENESDPNYTDEANRFEITQKITLKMQELFLTTANNRYRIKALAEAVGIPEDKMHDFTEIWKYIRNIAFSANDLANNSYTRNRFYEDLLIKKGTPVPQCILDYKKPFTCELKQIVDYHYMINLPSALGINPMSSYDNGFSDYAMSEKRSRVDLRTVSADELRCSVATFYPDFLKETYFSSGAGIGLTEVAAIRGLESWQGYMEALDASRKRANLNEIDFHDVEEVWLRYRRLMKECSEKLPSIGFEKRSGSLSVIYHFGNCELITVYSSDSDIIRIRQCDQRLLSPLLRQNVTIDFACGDILENNISENCFIERLRLFEGVLLQSAAKAYEETLAALREHSYCFTEEQYGRI